MTGPAVVAAGHGPLGKRRLTVKRRLTAPRDRRVVETPEFASFAARFLRPCARRVGDGDVEGLAALVALRPELDGAIAEAVAGIREPQWAYSWRHRPGAGDDPAGGAAAVRDARRASMGGGMTMLTFECGCEGTEAWEPSAFCPHHARWMPAEPLYRCGECGFASVEFERLERHVYGEHLGADVARPMGVG